MPCRSIRAWAGDGQAPKVGPPRFFWMALALIVVAAVDGAVARAADVSGNTSTIPYYYTETLQNKERSYLSLFEFVDVSANNLGVDHLDIYFSGWGRGDAITKIDPKDTAIGDAQLDSLYLKWRDDRSIFEIDAGRKLMTVGAVNEQIDGAMFQLEPVEQFGIQGFGGVPVFVDYGDHSGAYGYGGRVYAGYRPYFEIGVSGGAFTVKNSPDRQFVGGDVSVLATPYVDVLGHCYYDFLYSSIFDADGMVVLRPAADMKVIAEYQREMPAAYLGMNSFFSVFTFNSINIVNGEWRYIAAQRVLLSAQYHHYEYDYGKPANRYGGSIGPLWGEKRENTVSAGLFKLDRTDNGYLEGRVYLYQDIVKKSYLAIDGIYYKLDRKIYNVEQDFVGTGTIGWHVLKDFDIQASGIYLSSPYYKTDVRGLMKISYNFGTPLQFKPGETYAKR